METYTGKIEENPYGDFYGVTTGIRIGPNDWMETIFRNYEGKNVKVTIEVLPDDIEEDDSPVIQFRLGDIVKNNEAIDYFGLNPWCVNEGSNPNSMYSLTVNKAKELGLI